MKEQASQRLISVVVPVYNEQDCLSTLYERTSAVMRQMERYDYEIVFFNDGSTDASAAVIEALCQKDSHCKAVFFARNYGYNNAIFYAMQQAKGDCAVLLHADLQNPPEVIPALIHEWEQGHDAVLGVKNKSRENKLMYALRTLAYVLLNVVFGMRLIPHATDFELLDKSVIRVLKTIHRDEPFLRDIVLRHTHNKSLVYYTQDRRIAGKSNFTFQKNYALAVSWITAASTVLPRRFLCMGILLFLAGVLEFFIGFLPRVNAAEYLAVTTPILLRLLFLMFAAGMCFAALIGEYIIGMCRRQEQSFTLEEEKRIRY